MGPIDELDELSADVFLPMVWAQFWLEVESSARCGVYLEREELIVPMTFRRGLFSCGLALLGAMFSGCILIGEFDDDYSAPVPQSIMYETCYSDFECLGGRYCEELVVPVSRYTDSVSAICTTGCFDDLDCDFSEFNGLPGACVDHAFLGGPLASRICVERCEIDADCDLVNGFGCAVVARERLCVPIF